MKAILIDDEPLSLNYLEHQLVSISDIQVIGKFTDPYEGKLAIENNNIDIVFLDIHLPQINGIELAEQLLEMDQSIRVVFVTAYDNYAIKAFEMNALDYVMKPISKKRLLNTIQRIKQKIDNSSTRKFSEKLKISMFDQLLLSNHQRQTISLHWRTTKVQQLFLYLLHNRGKVVGKFELVELLWPDLEPHKANAQLYTAIYHIRKTLADFDRHFHITNTSEGYLLTLRDVILDVEEFEQYIRSEQPITEQTIADYEHAVGLYKGKYLQGFDYIWAESERQRLQLLWIRTSLKLVYWYYTNHFYEKAMELGLEICRYNPLEEEAYFLVMKAYTKIGKNASVHLLYQQLQEILMEELNEKPNSTITNWYRDWEKEK
ncbi:response regulator [Ornithinibacillus salinisoli]|uniref:Response regulator n=1 Tax=Ornithinibacillus salinisoli TaxID=1848459 RepID=A0ABW4W601_9BACI